MTTSQYPGQIDIFVTHQDNQDRIFADHPNYLQSAVVNIETELGAGGVKGSQTNLKLRLSESHDETGNNVDWYTNNYGSEIFIGDIVVFDQTSTTSITLSGGIGNDKIVGVVTETTSNGSLTPIISNGLATAKIYAETGNISVGDWLTTSTIPGFATKALSNTKTYFARATRTLSSGSSGYHVISVGVTNSSVIEHGHTSVPGDGGQLGDNVVDNRVLKNDEDYVVRNFSSTESVTISGDLIVLGKEIVTQVEIISGSQILASDLTVYGNSYLGNQISDITEVQGVLQVADDPSTVNINGTISFGKYNDLWNGITFNYPTQSVSVGNSWDFSESQYVNLSETIIVSGENESFSNLGRINDLLDPTLPQDAATKIYVDTISEQASANAYNQAYTLVAATSGSGGGGSSFITGTLGETINPGQPAYQKVSDGLWYLAQAIDDKVTMLSICKQGGTVGQTGTFIRFEKITGLSGLPTSSELYLSQTIAGGITSSVPSSGIVAFLGLSEGTTTFDVGIALVAYDSSTANSSGQVIASENLSETLAIGNSAGGYQIDMNLNKIIGLGNPTLPQDATTKIYVDTLVEATSGQGSSPSTIPTLTQVLSAGNSANGLKITNLADPTENQDAATKAYVDTHAVSGSSGAGITWSEVTGTTQAAVANNGYIINNEGLVTVTLPTVIPFGSTIAVVGKGIGGWKISQNNNQSIHYINVTTTIGTSGYIASTSQYDCIELLNIVENNEFVVRNSVGTVEMN
jgi:hypothetical protein